ncbi:MAG: hypothetical protein Q9208_005610 [Pyrenodesmia sp. 3 TL-2023]
MQFIIISLLALSALSIASPLGNTSTSAIVNAENAHVGYHHAAQRAGNHTMKPHRPVSSGVDAENAHVGYHHTVERAVIDVENARITHWLTQTSVVTGILTVTTTALLTVETPSTMSTRASPINPTRPTTTSSSSPFSVYGFNPFNPETISTSTSTSGTGQGRESR